MCMGQLLPFFMTTYGFMLHMHKCRVAFEEISISTDSMYSITSFESNQALLISQVQELNCTVVQSLRGCHHGGSSLLPESDMLYMLPCFRVCNPISCFCAADNLWWSSVNGTIGNQPNLAAPRCLPCGFRKYGTVPHRMCITWPGGCC